MSETLFADVHIAAALLLARSNNIEDAMGEYIPQPVYDWLWEHKLLRMASDQTGECWAVTTDEGDAYLRSILERRERGNYCAHGYVLPHAEHPSAGLETCPRGCTDV